MIPSIYLFLNIYIAQDNFVISVGLLYLIIVYSRTVFEIVRERRRLVLDILFIIQQSSLSLNEFKECVNPMTELSQLTELNSQELSKLLNKEDNISLRIILEDIKSISS